jgi:hypothetical protein
MLIGLEGNELPLFLSLKSHTFKRPPVFLEGAKS